MMSRFLSFLFFSILSFSLTAQFCGTEQATILERTDVNKKIMVPVERGVLRYIPVTFHLVANSAGNGRIIEENVLQQVANINAAYADQEAIFYIDRFNYFDNDAVYNSPRSSAARTQMTLKKDNNSVNIFIVNNIESSGPGQTLAYYDPSGDWIVSRRGEINSISSTLSHEVGHFFSLAHPFNGWDCHPYSLDEYTNPVNVDFTIPCEGGGGSERIELHDRSNCNTAGDRICDTPEDYNLGLLHQPNDCSQNNSIMDKNGEVIKPMTNNFMSYYTNCSSYAFSNTQKNLMNTDFFTPQRAYIRTGNIPNTTPVTGPVSYIYPIGGEETNGASNILLNWEDTPGANQYLVIYDRFSSFTFSPVKKIVNASELLITEELTQNVTYYWKVWPFNESQTNAGYSASESFRVGTGTAVNEISAITEYALTPNPVMDHAIATLTLSSAESFAATLQIISMDGQIMHSQPVSINTGKSQHTVPTDELPVGIYLITLESANGRFAERVVVLD